MTILVKACRPDIALVCEVSIAYEFNTQYRRVFGETGNTIIAMRSFIWE